MMLEAMKGHLVKRNDWIPTHTLKHNRFYKYIHVKNETINELEVNK